MNELINQLDYWRQECQNCAEHHKYTCDDGCTYQDECDQAYEQIKQLIELSHDKDWEQVKKDLGKFMQSRGRQVDEEFIEKKARELLSAISLPSYDCSRMLVFRTFIRSIVSEIQKPQAKDELFEIKAQEYERGLKDGRLQIIKETKETHAKIEELKSDLLANQKKYPLSYPNYQRDLDKIMSRYQKYLVLVEAGCEKEE